MSSVTLDRSGNLFGTTTGGGTSDALNGPGTVYEIARSSMRLKTLAVFNGTNEAKPVVNVTFDSQGNLFGTTNKGGANNKGTVYEIIAPGSSSATPRSSSATPRSSSATPRPPRRAALLLTALSLAVLGLGASCLHWHTGRKLCCSEAARVKIRRTRLLSL